MLYIVVEGRAWLMLVFVFPPSYAGEAAAVVDTAEPEGALETHEKCCDMRDGTQPPTSHEGRGRASDTALAGAKVETTR